MKRYICSLTLLGLLAVPDWASACYVRQWFASRPCYPMPPACYAPPVCYNPPVVYVPVYVVPQSAPRVQQVIPQAMIERDTPATSKPPVRSRPTNEPVRPATAVVPDNNVPNVTPMPVPMPMKDTTDTNTLTLPPASPMTPKTDPNPLKVPDANPLKFPDVPLTLPGAGKDATPTPAPAPDMLIPPMFPKIPENLTPKSPTTRNDVLPPLVLPPEANGSTSKSSPLTDRSDVKVQVLVAEGKPAFGPTRTVCFFNHTGSDIELVIEGRSVMVPKQTYINAKLAPTFRWNQRGETTRTETVPEGAAGLDVVFRE